jgi:hypothetical protein
MFLEKIANYIWSHLAETIKTQFAFENHFSKMTISINTVFALQEQ